MRGEPYDVRGMQGTITDQMQAVNEGTQGRYGLNKRDLLGWFEDVWEAAVFNTSLPVPPHPN